jgi:hypothetical protein
MIESLVSEVRERLPPLCPAPMTLLHGQVFRSISGEISSDSTLFRISIIADALNCHPDIGSWYDSFGTPTLSDLHPHDTLVQEIDYSQENPVSLSYLFRAVSSFSVRASQPPLSPPSGVSRIRCGWTVRLQHRASSSRPTLSHGRMWPLFLRQVATLALI